MNASKGCKKLISANNSSAIFFSGFIADYFIHSLDLREFSRLSLFIQVWLERWLLYRSILSLRAFQTIYWAKCEFAWSCWQIRWKIVRVTLVYSGCIYQRKSWAQDQDLVTPLISPNPAPDHIADFHLFLNIVRSTIRGGVSVQQRVFFFTITWKKRIS